MKKKEPLEDGSESHEKETLVRKTLKEAANAQRDEERGDRKGDVERKETREERMTCLSQ